MFIKFVADGSANEALITNGSGVLSFAAVGASAGQVIQVLSATDRTARSTSSTSFVIASNTCSVAITPSSASNKILILATVSGSPEYNMGFTIFRDGSNVTASSVGFRYGGYGNQAATGISFLDSPATTSSVTYDVRFRVDGGTGTMNNSGEQSTIIVLEIKG